MPAEKKILSLDSLLLSVLVIANIVLLQGYIYQKSLYIGFLLVYILFDFFSNTCSNSLKRLCASQKHTILLLMIFLLLMWPALSQVKMRYENGPQYFAHDGLIQVEESVKFLLEGKNPYTEDYFNTPMERWEAWNYEEYGVNPALYHLTYLPFLPLFTLPFYLLSNAVVGWFDLRFIFLLMFVVVVFVLGKMTKDDSKKLQLLMLFSLNPWFTEFFDEGRNDIFILFWVVLTVYVLKKNRVFLSSVFLAFACLSKQMAWILIPFYYAYIMKGQFNLNSLKQAFRRTYPLLLLSFVVITPFLIWDYSSFIDDVFSYTSGTSETSYPASGYGLATILTQLGYIQQSDYFPFWTLQLLVGLPLLYVLLKKQQQSNTLKAMLINFGLLSFAVLFVSRLIHDNHIGYVISLLVFGYYMDD